MDEPGLKLRQARERLNLKIREVEEASRKIAEKHGRDEYAVVASRLSEIENRGLTPSLHKLYSLCSIYRLDFEEVLGWYGISLASMVSDGQFAQVTRTHPVRSVPWKNGTVLFPITLEPGFDPTHTTYLTRSISRWGKVPLLLLDHVDPEANQRYAFIGTEDWFMYPLLQPGTFIVLDETKRRIVNSGWTTELERPIYFIELRSGYYCCWCSQDRDRITLIPHPASGCAPVVFSMAEVDIHGQVVAYATRFDEGHRRRPRFAAD
ncbi:MAG TPA: helix-turn-helix transcriptional regulator [Bryobacteraceae bacterium]|nr:helix-turn-helix transcriptional regulator [Bryobacteraceae bacterium]HTQ87168.1 helix-turn-helix transcriptional regulator [Candidatus Solibacter sp.]